MSVTILRVDQIDIADLISRSEYRNFDGAGHSLEKCYIMSTHCWAGVYNDKVACVWGLIPPTVLSNQAYLWLLTTDDVKEHEFIFVRYSQRVIEEMFKHFDIITGHCITDQKHSIRWLKWLGAKFGPPQGRAIPFTIKRKSDGPG